MEDCKQEPLSEGNSEESKTEELPAKPLDVPWKEEDVDIKDEKHTLGMVPCKIKTEPQDDLWNEDDGMGARNKINPMTKVSSTLSTENQNAELACYDTPVIEYCEPKLTAQDFLSTGNNCNVDVSEKCREGSHIPGFHQCGVCEALFKDTSDLEVHLLGHENHAENNTDDVSIVSETKRKAQDGNSSEILEMQCSKKPRETHNIFPSFHMCRVCKALFREICDLQVHMFQHKKSSSEEQKNSSSIPGFYRCEICEALFTQFLDFEAHVRAHTSPHLTEQSSKKGEVYLCEICEKTFKVEIHFEIHFLTHTNSLVCRKCKRTFTRKHFLIKHLQLCIGEDLFECHICKEKLSKSGYEDHLKLHADRKKFSCIECSKTFPKIRMLRLHIRETHSKRYSRKV